MRAFAYIVALIVSAAQCSVLCADTLDRLRPEKLKAVHEAIEALKSKRQEIGLESGYDDVRTLLHVHSAFSHDSRGTIEEIVAAAKEADVRVIMFNEHPANTYDYFVDGHRGVKDGVLLIPGAETEGFLAYPRQSIRQQKTESPQAFSDLVRSTGGQIFVCHLEERMEWEIANVTGTEIYNTHADLKEEKRFLKAFQSPLMMFNLVGAAKQFPQEVFGAVLDYPADYLKRYDQLCQIARHTGVSANDAHHNQAYHAKVLDDGTVLVEDVLGSKIASVDPDKIPLIKVLTAGKKPGDLIFDFDLDPYVRSFRHVSTHLLLPTISEAEVRQALSEGRAYIAFDWLADPTGFVFQAQRGEETWPIGSEVPFGQALRLRASAPLGGRFKVIHNGVEAFSQDGNEIDYPVEVPGVYRVEVWLKIADEDRPWILTNPIYVRSNP